MSEHVFDTVGLSKTANSGAEEIYHANTYKLNINPQQAMGNGIDIRLLPIQCLIFEIQ